MRLLLVRHAIAVQRGTPGVPDDERALTPRGRKRFRSAADGLARLVAKPDVVLSSPLVRAMQTAQIACRAWGGPKIRELRALASGDIRGLAAAVDPLRRTASRVALFGHEPHMSALLAHLLGSRQSHPLTFRKGGAALVDLAGPLDEGGDLIWFLPPRVLRELG